ncbi:hypothetical protein ACYZUC_20740 [Pseudomonas sp. GT1P32]
METIVEIGGVPYTFVTEDGATALRLDDKTTASNDTDLGTLNLPEVWLVTRSNGVPLFAVKPDICDKPFRILSAEKLYAEKIQWFEPLAGFYRERLWVNPESNIEGSEVYGAYRQHTWQSIIDFAIVDRPSLVYYRNLPGDWKKQPEGGAKYLLCLVEGDPYWTDGLGQIPFAVDTFRKYWEETHEVDSAIRKTGQTGLDWADGTLGGSDDGSKNVYDNFIIIRACLWASENFELVLEKRAMGGQRFGVGGATVSSTVFKPASNVRLKTSIDAGLLAKYKTWEA